MAEIRLGKAASEFNVSTQTIIESLQKKGFAIENKPTAKLTEEMYSYISGVFSSDKEAKEQSKSIGLKLKKREDASKPEEVSPKAKTEEPVKAAAPEPKVETAPEIIATETNEEETPKTKSKSKANEAEKTGLVVKGKIELPGSKKKKEDTTVVPEPIIESIPEPIKTPSNTEEPVIEDDERELVKANLVELDGLTIKGKIELKPEPVIKPKSHDQDNLNREKRKRKTGAQKVNIQQEIRVNKGAHMKHNEPKKEITQKEIQEKLKNTLNKSGFFILSFQYNLRRQYLRHLY